MTRASVHRGESGGNMIGTGSRITAPHPSRPALRTLDLFSGIGGLSLGLSDAGMETVAFCEIDPFCRRVLAKHWPTVPIYEDVRELKGDHVRPIDVICGGFPCQDISWAGDGAGIEGARSGLWRDFARLVGDLRPKYVIVENVAALLRRGMSVVCGDLARLGYDAEWSVVSACSLGAPHVRRRVFIVAYPHGIDGRPRLWHSTAQPDWPLQAGSSLESARAGWQPRLANPSELYRGADGLPFGMDRNRGVGNSVVPQIAEAIGRAILEAESAADTRDGCEAVIGVATSNSPQDTHP